MEQELSDMDDSSMERTGSRREREILRDKLLAVLAESSVENRRAIELWLSMFKNLDPSFEIAVELCHDTNVNDKTLEFCSSTIRHQLLQRININQEHFPEKLKDLKPLLLMLLQKFHYRSPIARTQISIALSGLAARFSSSANYWGTDGFVGWLNKELKDTQYEAGFLECLAFLPEFHLVLDTHGDSDLCVKVNEERCSEFHKELTSQRENAICILTDLYEKFKEQGANFKQEQILEAFAHWLCVKDGIFRSVNASHPLVVATFENLRHNPLSEATVKVISSLTDCSITGSFERDSMRLDLQKRLIDHLSGLMELIQDSTKDMEVRVDAAKLIVRMGEFDLCCVDSVVYALLEVASHQNYDISSTTFKFWGDPKKKRTDKAEVYMKLLECVFFHIQPPKDVTCIFIDKHRSDLTAVLATVVSVLGDYKTLAAIYGKVENDWRKMEAALFCFWVVSNVVPEIDAKVISELMPKVMESLVRLPRHRMLLDTACLAIGAYSKWLGLCGPEILPSLLKILVNCMRISATSASAAAHLFHRISSDDQLKHHLELDEQFNVYKNAVNDEGTIVPVEVSMQLVTHLSTAITKCRDTPVTQALEKFCQIVVAPLIEVIQEECFLDDPPPALVLTTHINRLGCIFRHVQDQLAVAKATVMLWPTFSVIFDRRSWDWETVDSLCQVYENAVRTAKECFEIGDLMAKILFKYKQYHPPRVLLLFSECLKIYGSVRKYEDFLIYLFDEFCRHTFYILDSPKKVRQRAYTAETFSMLAYTAISCCPQIVAGSLLLPKLINCLMTVLEGGQREELPAISDVRDRESVTTRMRVACGAVFKLFCEFLKYLKSERVRQVILPHAPDLVMVLVTARFPVGDSQAVITAIEKLASLARPSTLEQCRGRLDLISSFIRALSCSAEGRAAEGLSGDDLGTLVKELHGHCDCCPIFCQTLVAAFTPSPD